MVPLVAQLSSNWFPEPEKPVFPAQEVRGELDRLHVREECCGPGKPVPPVVGVLHVSIEPNVAGFRASVALEAEMTSEFGVPVADATPVPLSFDHFFTDQYPRLVVLLTALTGTRAVAEELAQEALVRAHQRWSKVSTFDIPAAWLRRVAINLAHNHRARRRSERRALERLAGERPVHEVALTRDDGTDDFWLVVRRLPKQQAAAVALYYLEDRPVAEVADILGCAEGTAKAHLHKGRANLAHHLEQQEHSDGHR